LLFKVISEKNQDLNILDLINIFMKYVSINILLSKDMSNILGILKKAQNALENPVYPDIRKAPPRFQDSGKHWTVDVGKTMAQTEFMPQFQENAILAQERDYNERIYGKSSHRDVVNKAFRPPLITQEDILPLNRIPRSAVVPRTNPYSNEFHLYPRETELLTEFTLQDKEHFTDFEHVKHGYTFPTFYRPLNINQGIGGVVPDLKLKVPKTSIRAPSSAKSIGMGPVSIEGYQHIHLDKIKLKDDDLITLTPIDSVFATAPHKITRLEVPDIDLDDKIPYSSCSASPSAKIGGCKLPESTISLRNKMPHASLATKPSKRFERIEPTVFSEGDSVFEDKPFKRIRTNASAKVDIIRYDDFGTAKLQNPISVPMQTEKTYGFKAGNNYKKPTVKGKPAFVANNYHTKGFIPKAGIDVKEVKLRKKK
jgi:hypothetical protein